MDQLKVYAMILLIMLTLSQVCGNPMFFGSQPEPDCQQNDDDNSYQNYQQNPYQTYQVPSYQSSSYQGSSYQDPSYQGTAYQGPSYQETVQAMITDTLRALCAIVQSTVQASKQEIATLARMILQKSSSSNCESDETPEEEYNAQPIEPTDGSPVEPQSTASTGTETSTSTSKPELLLQNNSQSTVNTAGDVTSSTTLASSSLKAGLNATLTSTFMTTPANSTTESTNTEIPTIVSATGTHNSNTTIVSEVITLTPGKNTTM